MISFAVRPITPTDRGTVRRLLAARWGTARIVVHGTVYEADTLPGFLAAAGAEPAGLVTYHITGTSCEIVSLDSLREGIGIGGALVEAVRAAAAAAGCTRLWLVTTNDNLPALRFYQKRGFRITAVHPGAVDAARQIKPEIPLTGHAGIPLHDEIALAMPLENRLTVATA
ncbi:MAG: GNAT family N-acetyltransferase [Anaerolineae bacterium]|nr:GNAT family N-acetyltransferase [Anaerolineae bacterium]